jgi:hypothetical protein
MKYARWRLRGPLILIAVVALSCGGAMKWRRYAQLREQIAIASREEKRLMDAYREGLRIRYACGNEHRMQEALLGVAAERRRRIQECERAIRRIW